MQVRPIIYIDQTSFNDWMPRGKTWQRPGDRIKCVLHNLKSQNFTLYGGITETGLFCWGIYDSTSIDNFRAFMRVMKNDLDSLKNYILVMDNHSSHRSQVVKDLIT